MIVGDTENFALESGLSCPVENTSQQALGFFLIHLSGRRFGVRDSEATLLGCSVEAVEQRLAMRGSHVSERLASLSAEELVELYFSSFYGDTDHLARSQNDFLESNVIWCPDGDAAFDDGSHVLQFDQGAHVRLVAFRNDVGKPSDLTERTILADDYYSILKTWVSEFRMDRDIALKNARR